MYDRLNGDWLVGSEKKHHKLSTIHYPLPTVL
jgi:hypothetical protein